MQTILKKLKLIVYRLAYISSYIFPYKNVSRIIRYVRITLYTGWVARDFKRLGKKATIQPSFSLLIGAENIVIGNNCSIGRNVQLTAWTHRRGQTFNPEIIFGNNCSINDGAHITAINSISVGDNVIISKNVLITDNAHGSSTFEMMNIAPIYRPIHSKGPVLIDDNVWIGEKASIMPGVHIGKGSIIGANAVVTKDVPPYSVVAGVPAIIVKRLRIS